MEGLSSLNMTVVEGETVMLVCTVLNLNDKSVREYVILNSPPPPPHLGNFFCSSYALKGEFVLDIVFGHR